MKKTKLLSALVFVLAAALLLGACSVKLGGEETWEYTAEDKKGSDELFHNFFEKTFSNTNQVITVTGDGSEVFVETIDGTSDHVKYEENKAETYSFIRDGVYTYAMTGETDNYYVEGEKIYNTGYFVYRRNIDIFEMLPDTGLTYSCKVNGSAKDGKSTSTLTFVIDGGESGVVTITATAADDLVNEITAVREQGGKKATTIMKIAYGSASVTVPDITGWIKEDY